MCVSLSIMPDCAAPWTAAHQALCLWDFPEQRYWSGLPFPFSLLSRRQPFLSKLLDLGQFTKDKQTLQRETYSALGVLVGIIPCKTIYQCL